MAQLTERVLVLDGRCDIGVDLADVRGASEPAPQLRRPDEPMVVTHTSGTTGVPKLVVHSSNTIIGRLGRTESIRWPILATRRDDTVAACLSWVHGRAIPWIAGVLTLEPRSALLLSEPDPASAAVVLATHRPSVLETHPNIYLRWERLAGSSTIPFGNVRLFVNTFDAIHPRTLRTFLNCSERRLPLWLQGWGQSECGPMTFRMYGKRSVRETGSRTPNHAECRKTNTATRPDQDRRSIDRTARSSSRTWSHLYQDQSTVYHLPR